MVETSVSEAQTSPIRVLHLIDGLSWGGSQRWVWDIVRLSDPDRFRHHIVSICPDSGDYVYADRLESAGVYRNVVESSTLRLLRKAILHPFIRYRLILLRQQLAGKALTRSGRFSMPSIAKCLGYRLMRRSWS
jgi:hypothetical protein